MRHQAASADHAAQVLRSEVLDINFHFAFEEYLMQCGHVKGPLLYLWRPAPVVTIGRHQNPWKECVLAKMEEENVAIARRRSGGGAVFQDPGCSVFTFISPSNCFSTDRNLDIVLGALRRCNIVAEKKGRNDLTFEGRKISGSAYKHAPDLGMSLHHGTVLIDTDMQALQRYLTPDKRKLQAKGVASVGARVMNLRERFESICHSTVCDALAAEFCEIQGGQAIHMQQVDEDSQLTSDEAFLACRRELESDEWRFGRTPEFTHQLETRIDGIAVFDVRMQVVNAIIQEAVIYSDALYPDVIDMAMSSLGGAVYGRTGIRNALQALQPRFTEDGPRNLLDALCEWLCTNVDD